jgi:CRP/FNR family cyclic AMP-dependent transcriptional regulator
MIATSVASPIELMATQVDSEILSFATSAVIFRRGDVADAIYGVRRGIVELVNAAGVKLCFRPGELFSYEDIIRNHDGRHSEAIALTPVELLRLDRLRFLNLLHNHPTLAVLLIGQQHERLREQRASGTCAY